jgi:DMSO/TMAO reductase YedYZ molybdopterin-dependent catalytic subunit
VRPPETDADWTRRGFLTFLGLGVLSGVTACAPSTSSEIPPAALPGTQSGGNPSEAATSSATSANGQIRSYQGTPLTEVGVEPENSIHGPQHVDIATYRLSIHDGVHRPIKLTYEQVLAMPSAKQVVTLHCVDGWSVTHLWEGVLLEDLLARAGGATSDAKVMIFECVDGFETSLPLDYIRANHVMLGYKVNGITLPPNRGFPFHVVAEDKFGYKWAKWVKGIDVNWDANYRGYWEFRGYPNDATVPPGTS